MKLTIEDLLPCPKCKETTAITFYKFTQYRPKEALGRCHSCQYQLLLKANHESKLVRLWNENYIRLTWRERC